VKPFVPSLDVCPPLNDPPDTDPTWETTCQNTCEAECENGIGVICGETMPFTGQSGTMDYAKVCLCVCPPKQCPQPQTQINNSEEPNNKPNFILLYKNPYPKILSLVLLSWKYVFVYFITLALLFLSLLAVSLYLIFLSVSTFIDLEQALNLLSLIFGQVLIGVSLSEGET